VSEFSRPRWLIHRNDLRHDGLALTFAATATSAEREYPPRELGRGRAPVRPSATSWRKPSQSSCPNGRTKPQGQKINNHGL
jgi:hypothetical protein